VAVVAATSEDVPGWLELAAEVEQLFGPMVDDPEFHRALARSISRTTGSVPGSTTDRPALSSLGR